MGFSMMLFFIAVIPNLRRGIPLIESEREIPLLLLYLLVQVLVFKNIFFQNVAWLIRLSFIGKVN